jgi:hypothetical protein
MIAKGDSMDENRGEEQPKEDQHVHYERHSSVDTVGPPPSPNGLNVRWSWQAILATVAICGMVAGLIVFSFSQFGSVISDRQAFTDRMNASEKDRAALHQDVAALQAQLTQFREEQIKNTLTIGQQKEDITSLLDGQRKIIHAIVLANPRTQFPEIVNRPRK